MAYEHGITVIEKESTPSAITGETSGVQVVIGTAPVHLATNPKAGVNVPMLISTLEEAKAKLGYSEDFTKYTLCEAMFASFLVVKVAPVVFINVLDPDKHKAVVTDHPLTLVKGSDTVNVDGILLSSVVVKSTDGATTYVKNTDYTIAFNDTGKPVISSLNGKITNTDTLRIEFTKIDASLVTEADIIGGYDAATGKSTGIELVGRVFPMFNYLPSLIVAPGWSHKPAIASIMDVKTRKINNSFNAFSLLDVDSHTVTKYEDAPNWKSENAYISEKSGVLWPKVKSGGKILWYSSILAAEMARTDAQNENVPHLSPSNKPVSISATVLPDGTEVYLDQPQANYLNGAGITTALNWNGWRVWGNNTGAYPDSTDIKDRFIAVRRVFDWWGNTFIVNYFDKVDDPTNYRLIESLVDSENLRANGYTAKGYIAGAEIEFREDMNPEQDLLNGKIVFVQRMAAFSPAEHIVNILEFDPTILSQAIFGGGE